jgi:hypothetical protein
MLAGRIPNASLITLAGGHDLQDSQSADSVARVVDNFLEGVL